MTSEGMAATPPNPEQGPRIIHIHQPQPPEQSAADWWWDLAQGFALTLVVLGVAALIVTLAYNGLTDLTQLPEIEWREAFAGVVILRVLALIARN